MARDLGINSGTLANWMTEDKVARGERLGPATADPDRVRPLEAENAELRMDRDVLKQENCKFTWGFEWALEDSNL